MTAARLADVIGHERPLAILRRAITDRRLHHALLFVGPAGVGKHTTALAMAARLLCDRGADDSCARCAACVQAAAGSHPDLHRVAVEDAPKGGKGREPKSRISIDQVRELQHKLTRRALAGAKKVAIIDDAHLLSDEAQNAFLKTLEEPPGDVLIVLVAASAAALLPTVRSRCQRVTFAPLPEAEVERVLRERGLPHADARLLAAASRGSLGRALATDARLLREALARVGARLEAAGGAFAALDDAAQQTLRDDAAEVDPGRERAGIPGAALLVEVLRARLRAAAGLSPRAPELTAGEKTASVETALRALEAAVAGVADLWRNAHGPLALTRTWLRLGESLSERAPQGVQDPWKS